MTQPLGKIVKIDNCTTDISSDLEGLRDDLKQITHDLEIERKCKKDGRRQTSPSENGPTDQS